MPGQHQPPHMPASAQAMQPPHMPAPARAMPPLAKAAPVHGTSRHHSSDMRHSNSTKRDSNSPKLDSEISRFQDTASKKNTNIDTSTVEQNINKKLKFSIDEILNRKQQKEEIQIQTNIKQNRLTQNLQSPPSRDFNTDQEKIIPCRTSGEDIATDEPTSRYTSEFMTNQVRSNSQNSQKIQLHQTEKSNDLNQSKLNHTTNQGVNYSKLMSPHPKRIECQQGNGNDYQDLRSQEVTSPVLPIGFKAAAAATKTSHEPYVTCFNRNTAQHSTTTGASSSTPPAIAKNCPKGHVGRVLQPTTTLHYMPVHQLQCGPMPRQAPLMQPPSTNAAPAITPHKPPPHAAPPATHNATQLHSGGMQRELRIGRSATTMYEIEQGQKEPINSFINSNMAQSKNRITSHTLPIAVMPSQQHYHLPTIKQQHNLKGQFLQQYMGGTNVHAPPPRPPIISHIYNRHQMYATNNWGSNIQARDSSNHPPILGVMPHTPPRHLLKKTHTDRQQTSWPEVSGNSITQKGHTIMARRQPPHPPTHARPPPPRPGPATIPPNLMSITSKMADMQCVTDQTGRPLREIEKNLDVPETIISQPDIEYMTTITSDDDENDIQNIEEEQTTPAVSHNLKPTKLSSIQLKTAKAMYDQEKSELQHKSVDEMLQHPDSTTASYSDRYDESELLRPLYMSSSIISSPGCEDKYKCDACGTEYTNRQSFRVHHRSKFHLNNFNYWTIQEEQKNPSINDSIIQAKKAIANNQQIHGMAQVKFFVESNQLPKEQEIEVIDLPKQMADQDYYALSKASETLKIKCPSHLPDFKRNILNVLSIIYFDRDACTLGVTFNTHFYNGEHWSNDGVNHRHWIVAMFDKLKQRPYLREYMKQHMVLGDLSFVEKTEIQLEEIKDINGMARLLFPIFMDCHFIPDDYVTLLAVLMNTTEKIKFVATDTFLNQGWFIDLLLNTGVAKLKTAINNKPIPQAETELDQTKAVPHTNIIDHNKDKTFLPAMNHYISDDLLSLQNTLQTDVDLNNGSVNDMDIDNSSWTLDHQIYKDSSNSTSTSTIPTIQDDIENEEVTTIQKEQNKKNLVDKQETEIEENQDDHPSTATIYVSNLSKETNKKGLMALFTTFGVIKKLSLKTQRRSKNKNAIIIFAKQHNARHAMLSLNSTTYKDKETNIRMSKQKSPLALKILPEESSISRLCTLVKDIKKERQLKRSIHGFPLCNYCGGPSHKRQNCPIKSQDRAAGKKCHQQKLIPTQIQEIHSSQDELDTQSASDINQSDNGGHITSEIQPQNDQQLQPDPDALAQHLFQHWERYLNFHNRMEEQDFHTFAEDTMNKLSDLISESSQSEEFHDNDDKYL